MFDINKYEKYLIKEYDLDVMRELQREVKEPLSPELEEEYMRVLRIIFKMEKEARNEGHSNEDLIDIRFDLSKKYHLT